MSKASEDKQLGELLATTGKVSEQDLMACLETQTRMGGPDRKRLGQILVECGHLSVVELQATLAEQGKQILWCPRCLIQVNVQGTVPDGHYGCKECHGDLEPAPGSSDVAARETWPAIPAVPAEEVSDEVRHGLADPHRRIGRYVQLSELGRGGMGVVYRCHDPKLNRTVAIKMILEADAEGVARFTREAYSAAKLKHPGIVSLYEIDEHEGRPFQVMDLVEGESFHEMLLSKQPTSRRIAEIIREVARALEHAHQAGIIHRDIKPQNVMIDEQGQPQLMDFGLARDTSAQQQLTQTGQVMGTPAYMAPEQAEADKESHGPCTDIYALGAMLYRALTRRPVFTAKTPAVLLKQILMNEPVPLRQHDPSIPADLETITLKCLEKAPGRRYPSAAAVADELGRFLAGDLIQARPITPLERSRRWIGRNRALSLALATILLLALVGLQKYKQVTRKGQKRRNAFRKSLTAGDEHLADMDYEQAIAEFARASAIDPGSSNSRRKLAEAQVLAGDYAGAIESYDEFIRQNKNKHQLDILGRANARELYDDLDGAIADYSLFIKLRPNYAAAWLHRGVARNLNGDIEGAKDDISRGLALYKKLIEAWHLQRDEPPEKDDVDAEMAALERAVKLEPEHPSKPEIESMLQKIRDLQDQARAEADQ